MAVLELEDCVVILPPIQKDDITIIGTKTMVIKGMVAERKEGDIMVLLGSKIADCCFVFIPVPLK